MSITPNLCCDETKNRGTYTRMTILNTILPPLPSCWDFSFALGGTVSFLVGLNMLLLTVVQQQVVILEFSQEKSARPATLPLLPRLERAAERIKRWSQSKKKYKKQKTPSCGYDW